MFPKAKLMTSINERRWRVFFIASTLTHALFCFKNQLQIHCIILLSFQLGK